MPRSSGLKFLRSITGKHLLVLMLLTLAFVMFSPQKSSAISSAFPNADDKYSGNNQCKGTKAGNFNLVVFVRILNADGTTNRYSKDFSFSVDPYNKFNYQGYDRKDLNDANKVEWDEWQARKAWSMLYRDNGEAWAKGPDAHTFNVKVANAAGVNSNAIFPGGQGNACVLSVDLDGNGTIDINDGWQPAYAFRDGDNTALDCWPTGTDGYKGGCGTPGTNRDDKYNNKSWILSCLASDATAYLVNNVSVYDASGGSWQGVTLAGTSHVSSPADGVNAIRLQSTGGAELNSNEATLIFDYKLPDPPVLTPNATLSGGVDGSIEPGQTATPSASITRGGTGDPSVSWEWRFWYDDNANSSYDAGEATTGGKTAPVTGTSSAYPATLSGYVGAVVPSSKRRICTQLRLYNISTGSYNPPSGISAPVCYDIVRKPFIRTTGDVNTTCVVGLIPAVSGNIDALWTGANGSASKLAVFAGGAINGFASAYGRTNPGPVKGLTFANSTGPFGGGAAFGEPLGQKVGSCKLDPVPDNAPTATRELTGLPVGEPVVYVKGDVYIKNDIRLSSSFTFPGLPSFKVVAAGNIYIDSSVKIIDGVYQAGGTIYTCTSSASAPTAGTIPAGCYDPANNLTVNGALQAKAIKYLRLGGTIRDNNPAETIDYNPLVWLPGALPPTSGQRVGTYDAYTTMPPIL